jgi:hypothetical protein
MIFKGSIIPSHYILIFLFIYFVIIIFFLYKFWALHLPKHSRPFAFNAHYVLRKVSNGKVKVTFLGPPSKSRPRQIWVAKSLIEKVTSPMQNRALKIEA